MIETKINIQNLKDIVTAADHLQEAGEVQDAIKILKDMARKLLKDE